MVETRRRERLKTLAIVGGGLVAVWVFVALVAVHLLRA